MNTNFDVMIGTEIVVLMQRDDITEIYINDDGMIRYISHDEGKVKTDIYLPPVKAQAIIELAAGQAGKVVNEEIPSISVEIQGYGARFQGELPPIVRHPQFNIRKKAVKIFSLQDYVNTGFMTEKYKTYLEESIKERKNILIAGGTGTGKTTFLNAILAAIAEISPFHRLISLEDLPELQCPADDYSPMFTMQDTGESKVRYIPCLRHGIPDTRAEPAPYMPTARKKDSPVSYPSRRRIRTLPGRSKNSSVKPSMLLLRFSMLNCRTAEKHVSSATSSRSHPTIPQRIGIASTMFDKVSIMDTFQK